MSKRWLVFIGLIVFLIFFLWLMYSPKYVEEPSTMIVVSNYVDIDAVDAKILIDKTPEVVVIDVSPFYEDGHLPGAVWYYYADGSLDDAISILDPTEIYLVYCHFDGPSRNGAQKLIDAGFSNVYRLTDHFSGWIDEGYPIEY